jgi:hypothetical protein
MRFHKCGCKVGHPESTGITQVPKGVMWLGVSGGQGRAGAEAQRQIRLGDTHYTER